MASSSPSTLSRYRPAVLAISGLAATYCIYLAYTTLTPPASPKSRLHRSNAVHRSRRRRHQPIQLSFHPQNETYYEVADHSPFEEIGHIEIRRGDRVYSQPISMPLPADAFQRDLVLNETEERHTRREYENLALEALIRILYNHGTSVFNHEGRRQLYEPLVLALQRHNDEDLLTSGALLYQPPWYFDESAVRDALDRFLRNSFPGIDLHAGPDPDHLESIELAVPVDVDIDSLPDVPPNDADTVANVSEPEEIREPGQGIIGLLYHIAEEEAKRQAYVHRGTRCDACAMLPIRGTRWHCINCPDYDLCSACESQELIHPRTHVFAKIKIPIPTLAQPHYVHKSWYPGIGGFLTDGLSPALRRRLVAETGFEDMAIDANFEQFCCLADKNGETGLVLAMTPEAFQKALTSDSWPHPLTPNFLYDRMFAFYDTNNDGLIDFEEFLQGLAYLRQPARRMNLSRVFQGYDVDGDGHVSRKDFMRMLSAKYAIHKTLINDMVATEEGLIMRDARHQRSNQPLSAGFTDADVPLGESRRPRNKPRDRFGEMQNVQGVFGNTTLPDGGTEMDLSFWNAVFDRYGRPRRVAELHPQFQSSLEARLEARSRFTGSESLAVGQDGSSDDRRFLVATDSRGTRGRRRSSVALEDRWRQDLDSARVKSTHTGDSESNARGSSPSRLSEHILELGKAYEVPEAEKDFGSEVLFQVVQEGFNELLDPLFKAKESMAAKVRASRREREERRLEIEQHKARERAFQEELTAGSEVDPLLAMANMARSYHPNGSSPSSRALADLSTGRQSSFTGATTRPRLQDAESPMLRSTAPSPSPLLSPTPVTAQVQVPALSPIDIARSLQEGALPTDEASLENLETSIRRQPLTELLEAAGYSVASPVENDTNAVVESSSQEASATLDRSTELHMPTSSNNGDITSSQEPAEPTLPHNRPARAAPDTARPAGSPMHLSPSLPATPLPRHGDGTSASEPRPQATWTRPYSPTATLVREARSEPARLDSLYDDFPDEKPTSATEPVSEDAEQPPSSIEWLIALDDEEAQIVARGGPGRINLAELEDAVRRDRVEGEGRLQGLVESWLEWAAF